LHGIVVRRRPTDGLGDPRASEVLIRRISIRYEDGRLMNVIPEAREEFFSQDDVERLVGVLLESSAALEWGQIAEGPP
jgi:hypothetical protein